LDLIPKSKREGDITSLILLTDGLANAGITDVTLLTESLKKQVEERPDFTLFTFGFGADNDDKMLKSLSETGKGLYYFIENVDAIPKAFGDCLGGLISVVAQNIKLVFEPISGTKVKRIITKYPTKEEISEAGETISIVSLGDLYSEEDRNIICELEVPPQAEALDVKILSLKLEYFNVLTSSVTKNQVTLLVNRLDDVPPEHLVPNLLLDKQRNRITTADALEKANRLGTSDKLDEARATLNEAIQQISLSSSCNEVFSQDLITDLKEALSRVRDRVSYETSGSKYMSSHGMSHNYQRSCHSNRMYSNTSKLTTMQSAADQMEDADEEVD